MTEDLIKLVSVWNAFVCFRRKSSSLVTDGGMEFQGKDFPDFLSKQGIQQLVSNSHHGVCLAERYNRTTKTYFIHNILT